MVRWATAHSWNGLRKIKAIGIFAPSSSGQVMLRPPHKLLATLRLTANGSSGLGGIPEITRQTGLEITRQEITRQTGLVLCRGRTPATEPACPDHCRTLSSAESGTTSIGIEPRIVKSCAKAIPLSPQYGHEMGFS